jgi:hypothetical protein
MVKIRANLLSCRRNKTELVKILKMIKIAAVKEIYENYGDHMQQGGRCKAALALMQWIRASCL